MSRTGQALERLAALATPVRRDLFDVLLVRGALTTTELRRLVPSARSSLAFEMGKLQAAGLAEIVHQSGRVKTWRAVDVPIEWDDADRNDPELVRALNNFERVTTLRRAQRMDGWFRDKAAGRWSQVWLESAMSTDFLMSLTPEELSELDTAIFDAVTAIRDRAQARQARGDGMQAQSPVFVCAMAFPFIPGGS